MTGESPNEAEKPAANINAGNESGLSPAAQAVIDKALAHSAKVAEDNRKAAEAEERKAVALREAAAIQAAGVREAAAIAAETERLRLKHAPKAARTARQDADAATAREIRGAAAKAKIEAQKEKSTKPTLLDSYAKGIAKGNNAKVKTEAEKPAKGDNKITEAELMQKERSGRTVVTQRRGIFGGQKVETLVTGYSTADKDVINNVVAGSIQTVAKSDEHITLAKINKKGGFGGWIGMGIVGALAWFGAKSLDHKDVSYPSTAASHEGEANVNTPSAPEGGASVNKVETQQEIKHYIELFSVDEDFSEMVDDSAAIQIRTLVLVPAVAGQEDPALTNRYQKQIDQYSKNGVQLMVAHGGLHVKTIPVEDLHRTKKGGVRDRANLTFPETMETDGSVVIGTIVGLDGNNQEIWKTQGKERHGKMIGQPVAMGASSDAWTINRDFHPERPSGE